MFKYTYILSESYRQNTSLLTPLPPQDRQQLLNTQPNLPNYSNNRPRISSSTSPHNQNQMCAISSNNQHMRRTKMAVSVPKFNYQIDNTKLLQSHKTVVPQYQEAQQQYGRAVKKTINENSLQNTFDNLNNLAGRHHQALREVELQNKLKAISVKYREQPNTTCIRDNLYQNYKMSRQAANNPTKVTQQNQLHHRKQLKVENTLNNVYSFNRLPQTAIKQASQQQKIYLRYDYSKPAIQTNTSVYGNQNEIGGITRKQVKKMISTHLSTAKFDRQRFNQKLQSSKQTFSRDRDRKLLTDTTNYTNSLNQTAGGKLAVQKLSSLQQKIRSSIKPYLNI